MYRILGASFGETFGKSACSLHDQSRVLENGYGSSFPEFSNETMSPLSLLKNLTWILHDTANKEWNRLWKLLFDDTHKDSPEGVVMAMVIMFTRWGSVSKAAVLVVKLWEEILAFVKAASHYTGRSAVACKRIIEWMSMPVFRLQFEGFAAFCAWWEFKFAYNEASNDAETGVAGFRAHRMPRFWAGCVLDLRALLTPEGRASTRWFAPYVKAKAQIPTEVSGNKDALDKIEAQINMMMKTYVISSQSHLISNQNSQQQQHQTPLPQSPQNGDDESLALEWDDALSCSRGRAVRSSSRRRRPARRQAAEAR